MKAVVIAATLTIFTACSSETVTIVASPTASTPSPVTTSETAAPSTSAPESDSPSPSPSPPKERSPYPYEGFPKVVPKSEVPGNMRSWIGTQTVVAVAPGVWTENIEGVPIMSAVKHGAYIGYCAAVDTAAKKLKNDSGSTCW